MRVPDGFRPAWLRAMHHRQRVLQERAAMAAMGMKVLFPHEAIAAAERAPVVPLKLVEDPPIERTNRAAMSSAPIITERDHQSLQVGSPTFPRSIAGVHEGRTMSFDAGGCAPPVLVVDGQERN
jgi:hypothetical protein